MSNGNGDEIQRPVEAVTNAPECVQGIKPHHMMLIQKKGEQAHQRCSMCGLLPAQIVMLNLHTTMTNLTMAVLLLLDDTEEYQKIKRSLFEAAKVSGHLGAISGDGPFDGLEVDPRVALNLNELISDDGS